MMFSMIPMLLAALAGQAASDVCSDAFTSVGSALTSMPAPTSSNRRAWCQANLTVFTTAVTTLNSTNCSNSVFNATPVLPQVPVLTAVCGPCGDAIFNITNLLPQGPITPLFCQQALPQIATALALLNGTACASMSGATDLSQISNSFTMMQSLCNPCLLQMMSVSDQLMAGCKPVVDASNGNIASSNAGTAASKPLCVSASCALAAPCTATNVQSVATTAQNQENQMLTAFTQIVQTWLPTFSCASVVTVVGTLSLNVSNAATFMNDGAAKSAVAAGIAQFLNVSNDSVSVTFPAGSRRLSERKLQASSLQVTYSIGVLSANAATITNKLAQATQSALATSINAAIASSGSQAGQVAVVGLTWPTTTTTTGTTVKPTGPMSSCNRAGSMMSFLLTVFVAFSFTRVGTGKSSF